MDRNTVIIIGVLVLIGLGFLFVTSMTGNVITGLVSGGEDGIKMESDYFKISNFGSEELNRGGLKDGEGRRR